MKDKKQELELSFIGATSDNKHRVLDRQTVDTLTADALKEIASEDAEM